ncbi:hypothetical protein TorRG33x02_097970, partial [Trema orientale]
MAKFNPSNIESRYIYHGVLLVETNPKSPRSGPDVAEIGTGGRFSSRATSPVTGCCNFRQPRNAGRSSISRRIFDLARLHWLSSVGVVNGVEEAKLSRGRERSTRERR